MRFIAFALTAAPILHQTFPFDIDKSTNNLASLYLANWLLGITIPAKEVIFGKQSYDSMSIRCFIAITVILSAVILCTP